MNDANKGEAERCLDIARTAAATRDFEKAQRFVDKSMRLYPCDEVMPRAMSRRCLTSRLRVDQAAVCR